MTRSRVSTVILVLLVGLIFALDVYATYTLFTSKFPGANDIYPRWRGAQLYWLEGINPYSDQATSAIQHGMYGRPAHPDEDQVLFAYPFYATLLVTPLIWLPYAWVQAIWIVIVEFALVGGVMLCLALVGWRVPHWLLGLTALWSLSFYHSTRTIVLGQFAALIFLWIVGALWALRRERDVTAGVLLALTTIKPQMVVLLIPALLLWGVGQRRWRFLGGFCAAMMVLFGVSFALLPDWLGQFVRQVILYPSYTVLGSPVWIVTHHYLPQLGAPVEIGVAALLMIYLLIQWRRLARVEVTWGAFQWIIGLTLTVTNLVVVRTATTNFLVLYLPLFFVLKMAANRLSRSNCLPGGRLLTGFYLLSVVGMWALFLATYEGKEPAIMYLILPVAMFVLLAGFKTILQEMPRATLEGGA